jgi:hypothetical protein
LKENKVIFVLVAFAVAVWIWGHVVTFHPAGAGGAIFMTNALTGCATLLYPGGEPVKICG